MSHTRSTSRRKRAKPERPPRFPADPRTSGLTKWGSIAGLIFRDRKARKLYFLTSDRRKVIAQLQAGARYVSPRHTEGTKMVLYRAFIDGVEFVGRSSGLVLVLRPRAGGGWR